MTPPRLLLVSYHFPPSEAAGALRWQRLAPMAVARGWDVDVISLARDQAEGVDERRLAELPSGVRIHEVRASERVGTAVEQAAVRVWRMVRPPRGEKDHSARSRTFASAEDVRAGGFDARRVVRTWNVLSSRARQLAWVRSAVNTGLKLNPSPRPDLVLSCGPPHLSHEAGRRLARAFGVPYVMDMRDTWTVEVNLPEELAIPLWFKLAERDEARCVGDASLVVMNTALAARAMQEEWPEHRVIAVMNGWDDEPLVEMPWPDQFRILYAGSIYLDRIPRTLFRAVAGVVRELGLTPADFAVRLIGSVDPVLEPVLQNLAETEGVGAHVTILPRMPRAEVLREYAEAAVLLSLPQGLRFAIPSKLFEYIRQPAWILLQSDPDSASAALLGETSAFIVDPEDAVAMTRILIQCYREFRAGRRPAPIARNGRWSRAHEGEKLMDALESLLQRSPLD